MSMVLGLMLFAGCGSTSRTVSRASAPAGAARPAGPVIPDTPAGRQARWLLTASSRLPIPAAVLTEHFTRSFLAQIKPAQLNSVLRGAGALLHGDGAVRFASVVADQPRQLVATLARGSGPAQLTVSITADDHGLISGLSIKPVAAAVELSSWHAIDEAVRSVAPHVHMLVADTTGGACKPIHGIDAATVAPLGSAFKLYVLNALGEAVAAGRVSWDQQLTVTGGVKSLPSGELETVPDGTRVTVREAARKMISISDNTAADMLIKLLGRPAIEASLASAGMDDPAHDVPFLTTRELFALKLDEWPGLATRYAQASPGARRALLAGLDDRPLPGAAAIREWSSPRAIDSVEWFASADDLCRAYLSLSALAKRPRLDAIPGALEINDGGLGLDPGRWKTTWFKGGSEPGVLTLTYQATTPAGRSYFVCVLTSDPAAAIDEAEAGPRLLSAVRGAFGLAAASGH
jgi:Beta-lactamase enzyme family/ORF 12 gene product N-terminal